jgi:hypothetical protein
MAAIGYIWNVPQRSMCPQSFLLLGGGRAFYRWAPGYWGYSWKRLVEHWSLLSLAHVTMRGTRLLLPHRLHNTMMGCQKPKETGTVMNYNLPNG